MDRINLIHGEGGKHTQKLIKEIFYKEFKNEHLLMDRDSANLTINCNKIAFTTDSFVVKNHYFLMVVILENLQFAGLLMIW